MKKTADLFPPDYFKRYDNEPDNVFYSFPRKVVHIDNAAIETLRALYAELIPNGSAILDLMSSWRSHLPHEGTGFEPRRVVGLGMNFEEMVDNPMLDEPDIWVQDLNTKPSLPFAEGEFDAVICAVSVQYLTQPLELFAEVNRILVPDGRFIISFSNRCFPSKATAVWMSINDLERIQLIQAFFEHSGGWGPVRARIKNQESGAPVEEDPLYMVWAEKATA